MEKQFLLEGEEILFTSNDQSVTLTNIRIRQNIASLGESHFTSIHLENICSIEIHYKSWIILIITGIIFFIISIILNEHQDMNMRLTAIAIGSFMIILYFLTRQHLITIASNGGAKIDILAKGMETDEVLKFVNTIEKNKTLHK